MTALPSITSYDCLHFRSGEAGFYAGFDSGAGGGERRRRSEGLSPDAVLSGALGLGFVLLFVGRYFQGNSGALQRVHHVRETYESAVDRWEAILTRKGGLAEAMLNPADTYTFHVITSLVPGQTSTQYTTHLPLEVSACCIHLQKPMSAIRSRTMAAHAPVACANVWPQLSSHRRSCAGGSTCSRATSRPGRMKR